MVKRCPFNYLAAMEKLANLAFEHKQRYRYCLLLACPQCGVSEVKLDQQYHTCSTEPTGEVKITGNLDRFKIRRLLYPHDVFVNLGHVQQAQVLASGKFVTEDAAAVIRQSKLPKVVVDQVPTDFELGPIFYTRSSFTTSEHWKITMACDRFLTAFNHAQFSALNGQVHQAGEEEEGEEEENKFDNGPYKNYRVDPVLQHIARHDGNPLPVLTIDAILANGGFETRQVQHNCPGTGSKSERGMINAGVVICELPDFPEPLARRYWYWARQQESDGAAEVQENPLPLSHRLLRWQVDREQAIALSHERAEEQN
ncbi:hypothetical protein BG000_003491 [Podila horticola]|nr:hypothetical protein BG000_003491 [Podila horticola]